MAKNTKLAAATVTVQADAFAALLNGGFIDIYDGLQPATADTAIAAQVKLARITFGNPAFTAAVNGVLTANAIANATAIAAGTAAWCRILRSNGTTVMDGNVGTSDANLVIGSLAIVSGATIVTSAFSHTVPR